MIRDSVIYIDIENVLSVEDNNQFYVPPPSIEETVSKRVKIKTEDDVKKKIDTLPKALNLYESKMEKALTKDEPVFNYTIPSLSDDLKEETNKVTEVSEVDKNLSGNTVTDEVEKEQEPETVLEQEQLEIKTKSSEIPESKYSLVYIRPTHCDSSDYIGYIKESNFSSEETLLFEGYENIYNSKERQYDLSLHYLNYHPRYINHLEKIMNNEIKLISFICDPLYRVVRHYNFSNAFKQIYSFDEFYLNFGDKYNVGWTGKKDITNNYFASYLGFFNIEDITEESVKERYELIFVGEKYEASFKRLNKLLKNENISEILEFSYETPIVNEYVKKMFIKNNELDYKLYSICCKLLEEPEEEAPEPEPEPEPEKEPEPEPEAEAQSETVEEVKEPEPEAEPAEDVKEPEPETVEEEKEPEPETAEPEKEPEPEPEPEKEAQPEKAPVFSKFN